MNLQEKQLGQLRPANTTAASLYSPVANVTGIIKTLHVCNTTASSAKFSIYSDDNGTTYDESTALFFDVLLAANTTVQISMFVAMDNEAGNFAVQTDTASAITFTLFGAETT